MDALSLLHRRSSAPVNELDDPGPDDRALEAILQAGVSAPDHGGLRPWRFLVVRGSARERLGELFAAAARQRSQDTPAEELDRIRAKPLRAPMILVVAARIDPEHPKVPASEQLLSAGAATQQMSLAAQALGFGAIWLTGPHAHCAHVAEGLGLGFDDRVVAFLHLGTPRAGHPERTRPDAAAFTSEWVEPRALETL